MLQTLLAERLKLELHREPRTMSFLAIVPAKNGHKLTPAVEGFRRFEEPIVAEQHHFESHGNAHARDTPFTVHP
jgi:uncharacterized protein (TIGR03435 family)